MIIINQVCHTYNGKIKNEVLHNVKMKIPDGKFVVLLGQSGSGKTTLLNIIAGLMKPTTGQVLYEDESVYSKSQNELCDFRHENIGFIFQNFFLEKSFTAGDNAIVPLLLNENMSSKDRNERVRNILTRVGLEDKIDCKPTELSGGECQRISIARALVNNPKIIIADEPTGNLDSVNGQMIIDILKKQTLEGKTVLMVTHNESYIEYADLVYRIKDGVVE